MLVVDDERVIADSIYGYLMDLRPEDAEVNRAYSAEEALTSVGKYRFDLVITDICMFEIDGLSMADRIQSLWPSCRIIVLTGYAQFDYAYRTMKLRHARYILKAEGFERIGEEVTAALREIDAEREARMQHWEMRSAMDRMAPHLVQRLIARLLSGYRFEEDESFSLASFLPINLDRSVVLLAARVDQSGEYGGNASEVRATTALQFLLEELLEPWANAAMCAYQGFYVYLIQEKADGPAHPMPIVDYLWQMLPEWQDMIRAQYGAVLSLCLANAPCPLTRVAQPFRRVVATLRGAIGRNAGALMREAADCAGQGARPNPPQEYPSPDGAYLQACLQACDRVAFFTALRDGIDWIGEADPDDPRVFASYACALSALLNVLGELGSADRYYEDTAALFDIAARRDWRRAPRALHDFALRMMDHLDGARAHDSNVAMEKVRQYICAHYAEDLTLSGISELFHFSPSYLSRLFHEVTGQTLKQHMASVRLRAAKGLLTGGNQRVFDIAHAVGFDSTKHFNAVFKRETGLTPIQWRETYTIP